MDPGRSHKTPGSETKDLIIGQQVRWFALVPLLSKSHLGWTAQMKACKYNELYYKEETLKLGKAPKSLLFELEKGITSLWNCSLQTQPRWLQKREPCILDIPARTCRGTQDTRQIASPNICQIRFIFKVTRIAFLAFGIWEFNC